MQSRIVCISLLAFSCIAGCESGPNLPKTVPVEGIVTLDGTPVADSTVVFIADQGTYNATGNTDANGHFEMSAFPEKQGAVPGSYKVEITKTIVENKGSKGGEAVVNLKYGLPSKYATFSTSGLKYTVPESGSKDANFELKSK